MGATDVSAALVAKRAELREATDALAAAEAGYTQAEAALTAVRRREASDRKNGRPVDQAAIDAATVAYNAANRRLTAARESHRFIEKQFHRLGAEHAA